jgi:hypothetical protein
MIPITAAKLNATRVRARSRVDRERHERGEQDRTSATGPSGQRGDDRPPHDAARWIEAPSR